MSKPTVITEDRVELTKRIAELEAALEPFAALDLMYPPSIMLATANVDLAHIRRAHKALEAK